MTMTHDLRIHHDEALSDPRIAAFLEEHLADMRRVSPPESVHALDLDALRGPDMRFWTLWDGGVLAGCGALRLLEARHGEVKSMRTAQIHLRRGVASRMLDHIMDDARRQGCMRVPVSVLADPSATTWTIPIASS